MKKQLSAIFTVCILLVSLAACGNKTSGNKTTEEVTDIAYKHAGITDGDANNFKIDFDNDDGVPSYEIEFEFDGVEYEYDIHSETGEILKAEKSGKSILSDDTAGITEQQAKNSAFTHAGVRAEETQNLRVEYDVDDGIPSYEIDFEVGEYEYEYDIHAETGEILKSEKEYR